MVTKWYFAVIVWVSCNNRERFWEKWKLSSFTEDLKIVNLIINFLFRSLKVLLSLDDFEDICILFSFFFRKSAMHHWRTLSVQLPDAIWYLAQHPWKRKAASLLLLFWLRHPIKLWCMQALLLRRYILRSTFYSTKYKYILNFSELICRRHNGLCCSLF